MTEPVNIPRSHARLKTGRPRAGALLDLPTSPPD